MWRSSLPSGARSTLRRHTRPTFCWSRGDDYSRRSAGSGVRHDEEQGRHPEARERHQRLNDLPSVTRLVTVFETFTEKQRRAPASAPYRPSRFRDSVGRALSGSPHLPRRRCDASINLHPKCQTLFDALVSLVAGLLEELEPKLRVAPQRRDHRPGARIDLRVIDASLVVDGVSVNHCETLHDAQAVAEDVPALSIQVRPFTFVTSTTSVFPSQRPRESPRYSRTLSGRWGRGVVGMTRCEWEYSRRCTT